MILNPYLDYLFEGDQLNVEPLLESFSETKALESYKNNLKVAKDFLKDKGISLSSIKSISNKFSPKIKKMMDSGLSPKEASSKISKDVSKEMITLLKKVKQSNPNMTQKIIGSVSIFTMLILSQSFIVGFLGGLISPEIAMRVAAVTLAPVFEEYAKRVAIRRKYPFVYTGIFAGVEFLMYVIDLVSRGANLPRTIIMRSITLLMHFSTTFIQKLIIDKYGIDSFAGRISWIIAVVIHSLFNILGIIYNREILELIS